MNFISCHESATESSILKLKSVRNLFVLAKDIA
jgi:hypothetical protein